MGLKKKIYYEFCLNDNDWDEIRKALPKLAQRRIVTGDDLGDSVCDEGFLTLLENRFGLSLAKEVREYLRNNEECDIENIPGLKDVIEKIDNEVKSYIDGGKLQFKASYFEDEEEFDDWFENLNNYNIARVLWDIIQSNSDNPLVDEIVSDLNKYC